MEDLETMLDDLDFADSMIDRIQNDYPEGGIPLAHEDLYQHYSDKKEELEEDIQEELDFFLD